MKTLKHIASHVTSARWATGVSPALGFSACGLPWVFLWGLWVLGYLGTFAASATPLDDQMTAFDQAQTQTENAVSQLLKTGLDEQRAAEAYAAVSTWLRSNPSHSPQVLFQAARAAQYAGEWSEAFSFYRKLLKNKSASASLGGQAAPAVYRLLINDMRDKNAAYLFMREEGNRLRQYGQTKQFDQWFLRNALQRGDLAGMADRLAAVQNDKDYASDYAPYMKALLKQLVSFEKRDQETVEALDNLGKVAREPLFKLRWDWIKTVSVYNSEVAKTDIKRQEPAVELLVDPLKAAQALVTADPVDGAAFVVKGWAQWNQSDTPTFFRFVHARQKLKSKVFIDALLKMSPDKAKKLFNAGAHGPRGRWVSVAGFISPVQASSLITRFPTLFNSLAAPGVTLWDQKMPINVAKAEAPLLARNPQPAAALIRAYAATGQKKVGAILAAMVKTESWRFTGSKNVSVAKQMVDTAWNSGFDRSGFDTNKTIKQLNTQFSAQISQLSQQISKKANSQVRLTAFNRLYKDLLSPQPSIPSALGLWDDLFTNAPDSDRITMFKTLVANISGDREYLLRRAGGKATFGGHRYAYLQFGPGLANNWRQWGRNALIQAAPELADHLAGILRKQMGAGSISEPLFGLWLYCVNPKNPEARKLLRDLVKSPAYKTVSLGYKRLAANDIMFGNLALTAAMKSKTANSFSRDLLALPEGATPAQVETAFKTVMSRVQKASEPVPVVGLRKVAELPELTGQTRAMVLSLFDSQAPLGNYPGQQGYEQLALRLIKSFRQNENWGAIVPYVSSFWRTCLTKDDFRHAPVADALIAYAEAALNAGHPSAALSIARSGLKSGVKDLNPKDGSYNDVQAAEKRRGRISQVAGKAGLAIGMFEIPVDATHPDYPFYKSNAEYVQGNFDAAWRLYDAHADQLLKRPAADTEAPPVLRKLPTDYGFWLLNKNIEMGNSDRAEALAKALTIWSRQEPGTFSLEQEGDLKLAFAKLAFRKGALDSSRALYRMVADAREYQGTQLHLDAALGSVNIDRINKNFGVAMTQLDKLLLLKDPQSRMRVFYAQAHVFMDQELYKEAFDAIQSVLRYDPNHADALLLQSKVQYKMRKLVEASQVMLGITREDRIIVPGETIKIDLHDPTLNISGLGADIEIEIQAKSGDKERVMLHQLGDDKERFRAAVPTLLGAPIPNDKTLQILGKDEIRFGYSKRFRAKMKDLPPNPDTVITVASDAYMALAAGAFPARKGERKLNIDELGLSTAQRKLGTRAVRPGNPIYLRVIDPDQSKTSGKDTLPVSLKTSSGDEIRRLDLQETGPFTGVFEGVIPTTGAQAMAFASESAPGRDPNMAISSEDYPGWLGNVGDKRIKRTFGVDLNDNAALNKMTITWGQAGQGLTHFVLQTSMNGKDWTTRARYPKDPAPWDGRPRVSSFPTYSRTATHIPVSTPEGRELPPDWMEKMELSSASSNVNYAAVYVGTLQGMKPQLADGGHPGYSVLMRYRALFYQPAAAIRRFQLTGYPLTKTVNGKTVTMPTIFLIDGEPAAADSDDPFLIERELKPGLHDIQVWRQEGRGDLEKRTPVLLCDAPGKAALVPCPADMFNPASFPEGIRAEIPQAASIFKTADTGIDISFGDKTRARLVRLVIFGFEGVAPAIKKVTLNDRQGNVLLPVKQDFLALRKNTQLEVLPGDRITALYEDPVPATPNRIKHSRSLTVAFNTAKITASFLNYTSTPQGRVLHLEQIRRFKFGDAIGIFIDDADMDSSPEKDVIEFTVANSAGKKIAMKAVETDPHSGRFEGRVFPVAGQPKRASEIQMTEGGTLTATYRDMENLDPGIPADRSVTIQQAKYDTPELNAYTISGEPRPAPAPPKKDSEHKAGKASARDIGPEAFFPRQSLTYTFVDAPGLTSTPLKAVVGADLRFDVVVPHLALAGSSTIIAYVQTEAGRQMAVEMAKKEKKTPADGPKQPYDINVPGTLKLTGMLKKAPANISKGYSLARGPVPPSNKPPLEEGRFTFSIPLALGGKPGRSFATKDADLLPSSAKPEALAVRAGDIIHVGYAYKDKQDNLKWETTSFTVGGQAFLAVMNKGYTAILNRAFVGEKIYLRVLGYGLDQTDERDNTTVTLQATSGARTTYNLRETEPHSGVFKGVFTIKYADDVLPQKLPPVELNGFPVRYGDNVLIRYAATTDRPAQTWTVQVNKGADGEVKPFSKRYTDDTMAIKTGFTQAECFFELAKKHRLLDQESLARREIGHARKLLAEAVASHQDNDSDMRAHAEYLLGNLAQEFADLAKNDEARTPMYQDALKRFSKIPMDYPDSVFAPKSQFKIGLVYEKMGEEENAIDEYIKLAYKYPNHELIPTVMLRLGAHFQKQGLVYKKKADPLREKEDLESRAEVLRLDEKSYPFFINAALIYKKLPERFPDNPLAGLSSLASAQNYMRAHQYTKAIAGFEKTYENEAYDGTSIRAQAMYWSGLSSERLAATMSKDNWKGRGASTQNAYKIYRRITFDFPDSKWAKFARGRLTDPVFGRIIELENTERQRMIETLEYEKKKIKR